MPQPVEINPHKKLPHGGLFISYRKDKSQYSKGFQMPGSYPFIYGSILEKIIIETDLINN
jgi:hypothetical protein